MKSIKYLVLLASILLAALSCREDEVFSGIVPLPDVTETGQGMFTFSGATAVSVQDSLQEDAARFLCRLFTGPAGFTPEITDDPASADIRFIEDKTLGDESYSLEVTADGIDVRASSPAGYFYAVQTIRAMLPPEIEGGAGNTGKWSIPAVRIEDSPEFAYRGLMLDVSRHFMPKEDVMKIIDCMAMLKLNTLHWHLTDDNGWRIEILKYPRLTETGAWRVDREDLPFPARRNIRPGEKASVGGFYTQEEIREVVSYAAERHIEIIPEIDLPAHANAALAAYPQYACPAAPRPVSVFPGMGEGRWDVIFCAGNDSVYPFIEDILDEVMNLFPSGYIHIGGDEAQKTIWKKCPLCQAKMKEEHIPDEEHLQGYFMGRIAEYLKTKGKTAIGWDELVRSRLPEGAVICGWQGDGRSAFTAAGQGHRFILAPARTMYFIRYQGPQWFEPLTYFGNITLRDVYEYDYKDNPLWKQEYAPLMMGMQACMWTEFCRNTDDVTYQLFPRLAAFSELVWSSENGRNWNGFLPRLDSFLEHLEAKDIVYAESMYNIQHTAVPADGAVSVTLECIRPDVQIRYTLDGSEPSSSSALYSEPVALDGEKTLKCATFFTDGRQAGQTLVLPVKWNKATGKEITGQNHSLLLTNGIRGSLRESDFEWCTWISGQQAEFVLDLGEETLLDTVTIGCLTNYSMGVNKPAGITVSLSSDGEKFRTVSTVTFSPKEIFREGNFTEDIRFGMPGSKARYVKVSASGAGVCPSDHVRPGQASKFCFDEISVN